MRLSDAVAGRRQNEQLANNSAYYIPVHCSKRLRKIDSSNKQRIDAKESCSKNNNEENALGLLNSLQSLFESLYPVLAS